MSVSISPRFDSRLEFGPIRFVDAGDIPATYASADAEVGAPLTEVARLVHFTNYTDAPIFLSMDGTNDHIFIAEMGFVLLDISTNRVENRGWFLAKGTQIYVRHTSAGAPSGSSPNGLYATIAI